MKTLITGGNGFIARNLTEQLEDKYNVVSLSRSELDLLDSVKVSEYLKSNKFDVIFHAATWSATRTSTKDLTKVFRNNLLMFFNLARCSKYFGKMIYYGSGAEYHRYKLPPKVSEDFLDTIVPEDDYGLSKYIMAKHAECSDNIYDLVLFGVYGKYEDWRIRFISNACCKAVWDLPITIKQNALFDYLDIKDLVKITEWFIENEPREKIYNVCTGRTFDLLALAYKVLAVSGKRLDIIVSQEGLGKEYSGDNSKLLSEIGDYTFRNVDDGIDELYHWYLERKDRIKRRLLFPDK
ncbi:NAD(P)-dependent oxidoreductase [Deltaproteobacteria bacterium]|nr:NAD(P)-dependent oxidoreductase [Deltaproteobacteria bacterium]